MLVAIDTGVLPLASSVQHAVFKALFERLWQFAVFTFEWFHVRSA